jgi:hypothetical protein
MPFGSRKTFRVGRFLSVNLSKRGATLSGRRGLVSTNSRTRKLQINLPLASTRDKDGDRSRAHIEGEHTALTDESPGSRNTLEALSSPAGGTHPRLH